MRNYRYGLLIFTFLLIVFTYSCQKEEANNNTTIQIEKPDAIEKSSNVFAEFQGHVLATNTGSAVYVPSLDMLEEFEAMIFKGEDEHHFLDNLNENYGYPDWNVSLLKTTENEGFIITLPFIKDDKFAGMMRYIHGANVRHLEFFNESELRSQIENTASDGINGFNFYLIQDYIMFQALINKAFNAMTIQWMNDLEDLRITTYDNRWVLCTTIITSTYNVEVWWQPPLSELTGTDHLIGTTIEMSEGILFCSDFPDDSGGGSSFPSFGGINSDWWNSSGLGGLGSDGDNSDNEDIHIDEVNECKKKLNNGLIATQIKAFLESKPDLCQSESTLKSKFINDWCEDAYSVKDENGNYNYPKLSDFTPMIEKQEAIMNQYSYLDCDKIVCITDDPEFEAYLSGLNESEIFDPCTGKGTEDIISDAFDAMADKGGCSMENFKEALDGVDYIDINGAMKKTCPKTYCMIKEMVSGNISSTISSNVLGCYQPKSPPVLKFSSTDFSNGGNGNGWFVSNPKVDENNPSKIYYIVHVNEKLCNSWNGDGKNVEIFESVQHELVHIEIYEKLVNNYGWSGDETDTPAFLTAFQAFILAEYPGKNYNSVHELMISEYLDDMVNGVKAANGNLGTYDDYLGVVLNGFSSPSEKAYIQQELGYSQSDITNIYNNYLSFIGQSANIDPKFTKC